MAGGRPNMVRADTLDLQDQDAPTAAEHHKHIEGDGIAPHQAAQFQHVQEERRSEEETLADAWNMAGQHGNDQGVNGNSKAEAEAEKKVDGTNTEAQDGTDEEDDDDDMMDRMSSSPSIEDGAFLQISPTIAASTSREGPGTPQHADFQRATFNQSPTPTLDSSPFAETPRHMPLRLGISTPQSMADQQSTDEDILSPSIHTPETSPLITTAVFGRFYSASSQHHRLTGRYGSESGLGFEHALDLDDEGFSDGGSDFGITATDYSDKIDEWETGEQVPDATQLRLSGNAFAQQHGLRAARPNVHTPPAFDDPVISNMQHTHLIVDEHLLNPRLSLISYDDDQWESDSSQEWTKQDYEDDDADAFLNLDDRFIDSGWGGECLRDAEDIDFEFVYALHTFVATVEGQANATKGDTMVLLDDSNSYWWLVRVVKDSSIGYLPAEHIETPTERLARLNKHRNIDLSQTMLGDNPEKTRNPLKKAMRRRTAKTVQFAAPTYVEASDYDYSTEDEDGMIDPYGSAMEPQHEQTSERGQPAEVEERNAPEEANVHATRRFSGESFTNGKASMDSSNKASMDSKRSSIDDPQLSPRLVDRTEAAPLKSRKGTPRNADSFLKDEGMETRKMTLTPGLLRDDTVSKASSTESTRTDSFESLVKTPSPQEERSKRDSKDKKKDKKPEKKQGMLSGLFKSKKKDKKFAARDEGELSDMEKVSAEMTRGSPQNNSSASVAGNVSPVDRMNPGPMSAGDRAQARAKLQKAQPPDNSRVMSPVEEPAQQAPQNYYQPPGGFVAELEGDNAAYEMSTGQEENMPSQQAEPEVLPPAQEKSSPLSPIANILRSGSTTGEPKPKKAKRSKQRVELDDFDEPEEDEQGPNPFLEQEERRKASQDSDRLSASPVEILSPGSGTFMHGTESIHIPQMNVDDSDDDDEDEDEDEEISAKSSNSPSTSTDPSFVEKPSDRPSPQRENTQDLMSGMPGYMSPPTPAAETPTPTQTPAFTPTTAQREKEPASDNDLTPTITPQPTTTHLQTPSTPNPNREPDALSTDSLPSTDDEGPSSSATPETPISSSPQQPSSSATQWDDANLRAWFDADDVKDMLAIIHSSKADVSDAETEHPSMQGLYAAERKGIEGMMGELDGLLGGLLKRKGVVFT